MADVLLNTREELIEKFGWEEYVVFVLMLLISALIGVFFWIKGQNSNSDFIMGGKSMGVLPMTMSLVASFMSAITLLGTPAEMYVFGTHYVVLVLSYPLVMAAAAHFYLPVFYKLDVSTSYEYLEWRFHKSVRILASCCFILQMVLYMAIVVYTPALALSQITGFQVDLACAIIFLVCIFYTVIGGIKAVMWTDTFQAAMMFGSFLAVIIKGNYDAGGTFKVFDSNYQTSRIELFDFSMDMTQRHTVWAMIIGGYFTWISIYGINQTQVQRYLSVPRKEMAVKAIWLNGLGIGSLLMMCAYAGLVVFAYYDEAQCDPIKAKQVETKDQIFPLFVMQVMGDIPCIPGLFVAGVFSGALSTVSSGLNSLAAVVLKDFVMNGCVNNLSNKSEMILTRGLAVGFGVTSYLVVFLVKYLPGVLEAALGIFGIVGGPVLGAFTLGMFVPWCNSIGAFVGMLTSLVFTMWIGFGQTAAKNFGTYSVAGKATTIDGCPSDWFNETSTSAESQTNAPEISDNGFTHLIVYEISYMWFSAIACMFCVVVGIIVSFLSQPQDPRLLNPDLISPWFKRIFGFWPAFITDRVNAIDIGTEYIPSKKESILKSRQIQHSPTEAQLTGSANEAYEMEDEEFKKA
ncbi:sodium-coupled monocarboxylate transporter 1-like [Tigriopus californicus]|uniref:sodium-coupled monocarboxylate transporter 1-like n=1 Tax=Tigriopus californicus TaxID=6832 RepID=UPI0027DA70E1|nr:sodium-coupled monocarboxylate transporter 1-like [Tigriopus californicus]